jgi:hypothetical protein
MTEEQMLEMILKRMEEVKEIVGRLEKVHGIISR